jgi:predicted nucleic acid-binding protein
MICLDTNYLIRALVPATAEARRVGEWLDAGEPLAIPAIAWYEFLCGSIITDEEIQLAMVIVSENVLPFEQAEAAESARLFNAAGRKRALRVDAMIAGTAVAAGARLATNNRSDFKPFTAHGLALL